MRVPIGSGGGFLGSAAVAALRGRGDFTELPISSIPTPVPPDAGSSGRVWGDAAAAVVDGCGEAGPSRADAARLKSRTASTVLADMGVSPDGIVANVGKSFSVKVVSSAFCAATLR